MNFERLKNELPDYAKDIRLNLRAVLNEDGSPGLNQHQILSVALASAYATRNEDLIASASHAAKDVLTDEEILAVKAAAVIMAMNNIYYRFTHAMTDASYAAMPANLRMNVIAEARGNKINFELSSLAVSALNGCAKCMNAHGAQLEKTGVSKQAIQSAVRIASVINAAAMARELTVG